MSRADVAAFGVFRVGNGQMLEQTSHGEGLRRDANCGADA